MSIKLDNSPSNMLPSSVIKICSTSNYGICCGLFPVMIYKHFVTYKANLYELDRSQALSNALEEAMKERVNENGLFWS